ncbi:MAG: hypothetical protein ACRDDH_11785 [Cetobacterium sp.]|uniref:hypothetical protein n=1 Tax=Cetobacterium sp. TaxID=2071632 RepID=UPI003EE7FA76
MNKKQITTFAVIALMTWIGVCADFSIFNNTGLHMTRADIMINDALGMFKWIAYGVAVYMLIKNLGGNKI